MAGTNQHHIPRFLQRGFSVSSNKHKIWRFDKSGLPTKPRSISRTGSEDDFYGAELDALISVQEQGVLARLTALRTEPVGSNVDPNIAAELIDHLAPRAAHLRQTMERGLRQLISGASELFSMQESVEAVMGLNEAAPSAHFEELAVQLFDEYPLIGQLGLPREVILRMLFQLTREQFEANFVELLPMFNRLILSWLDKSADVSRSGHNKALGKAEGPTARRQFLAGLEWEIVEAPQGGAILPDCIAIALLDDGSVGPLTLVGTHGIKAVAMPLASSRLLVGTHDQRRPRQLDFNEAAARSSHLYFLAATNDEATAKLQPLIDERSSGLVDEAVSHVFKDFLSAPAVSGTAVEPFGLPDAPPTGKSQYEISYLGCATEDQAKQIGQVIESIVSAIALQLPLNRFDGITFAADYAGALASIDRGILGARVPMTTDPELAIGIAQTVNVVRDGMIKCRLVMNGEIGHALVADDDQLAEWALGILIRQLDLVAITEFIDTAIPGVLLRPIEDSLQSWLYPMVGAAAEGYIAGHLAVGFGNSDQTIDDYRNTLGRSLERALETIPAERLAYRYHGDLDRLLSIAVPLIRDILTFAADLFGFCSALRLDPVIPGSELDAVFQRAGLGAWPKRYLADLDAIRLRLGKWESFDEFLVLTIHAERLMWQFGMIPWATDQGVWVEIPLATDASQLQPA